MYWAEPARRLFFSCSAVLAVGWQRIRLWVKCQHNLQVSSCMHALGLGTRRFFGASDLEPRLQRSGQVSDRWQLQAWSRPRKEKTGKEKVLAPSRIVAGWLEQNVAAYGYLKWEKQRAIK